MSETRTLWMTELGVKYPQSATLSILRTHTHTVPVLVTPIDDEDADAPSPKQREEREDVFTKSLIRRLRNRAFRSGAEECSHLSSRQEALEAECDKLEDQILARLRTQEAEPEPVASEDPS